MFHLNKQKFPLKVRVKADHSKLFLETVQQGQKSCESLCLELGPSPKRALVQLPGIQVLLPGERWPEAAH